MGRKKLSNDVIKDKWISAKINAETRSQLDAIAQKEGRTLSNAINQLLVEALEYRRIRAASDRVIL